MALFFAVFQAGTKSICIGLFYFMSAESTKVMCTVHNEIDNGKELVYTNRCCELDNANL